MMPFRNDPTTREFWDSMRRIADTYEFLTLHRFGQDSLTGGHDLFEGIRDDILRADFCLSDFTLEPTGFPNLNVLTEAGIALGAQKHHYLIARAPSYGRLNAALPSDWKGQYVEIFPQKDGGTWEGLIRDFFEKILNELGKPTTEAKEKPRENDGEQMRWLLKVVQAVREEARELYDETQNGTVWTSRRQRVGGLPQRFFFPLTSPQAPNVKVAVGAFFDLWTRDGTPLHVGIQTGNEAGWEYVPVRLDKSLTEATTRETVSAFIQCLDQRLVKFTPGLSRPTLLSRTVLSWDAATETVRKVVERSTELAGELKNGNWSEAGCVLSRNLRESRFVVRIGIDLERWAEKHRTPLWIVIEPQQGETPEILSKVKLPGLRTLRESGSVLVPVPMEGEFEAALELRIKAVAKACKRAAGQADVLGPDGDVDAIDFALAGDGHKIPTPDQPAE